MPLTGKQKRYLRGLGHHLRPVVMIGQRGVTPGLVNKVRGELLLHELVKIKIGPGAVEDPDEVLEEILKPAEAEHVQTIGRTLLLYKRREEEPDIELP